MRSSYQENPEERLETGGRGGASRLGDEQRLLYLAALMWLLFWGTDVLTVLHPSWSTLASRCVWAGLTVAVALLLPRVSVRRRGVLRVGVRVVLPPLFLCLLAHQMGGRTAVASTG